MDPLDGAGSTFDPSPVDDLSSTVPSGSDGGSFQQALGDAGLNPDGSVPDGATSATTASGATDSVGPATGPGEPGGDGAASAADLIGKATDPATGKVDTNGLATLVADANKTDPAKASAAYDQIRAKLSPDDATQFDKDVVRAADDVAKGTVASKVGATGTKMLVDNPILSKIWENTESEWTGKSGFTKGLNSLLRDNGIALAPEINPPPPGSLSPTAGVPASKANNTNGRLARDAIADSYRAEPGTTVRTEQATADGSRRVDVTVDKPAADRRMSQRLEIESKVGRTGQSPEIVVQVAKDAAALSENGALRATGRALETVGKVAGPVAVAADAIQLGTAFHDDGNKLGDHTGRAASGIAGGWGGAWAGAEGGAALGALGGSVVPVVGTAAGGLAGGIIGGIGGAVGGDWIGRRAYDWAKSLF